MNYRIVCWKRVGRLKENIIIGTLITYCVFIEEAHTYFWCFIWSTNKISWVDDNGYQRDDWQEKQTRLYPISEHRVIYWLIHMIHRYKVMMMNLCNNSSIRIHSIIDEPHSLLIILKFTIQLINDLNNINKSPSKTMLFASMLSAFIYNNFAEGTGISPIVYNMCNEHGVGYFGHPSVYLPDYHRAFEVFHNTSSGMLLLDYDKYCKLAGFRGGVVSMFMQIGLKISTSAHQQFVSGGVHGNFTPESRSGIILILY